MTDPSTPPPLPSFREALRFWWKLGWISFGGPAGQIAIMHKEIVERRRWLSEDHFLHALNFCMLLPGPEAQQLATYLGWRLHGARGGIAAGVLFVLPSVFILFGLSWLYMAGGDIAWMQGIFYGLMPAVIAIVASAVKRIGSKALKSPSLWVLAALSFVAIFHLQDLVCHHHPRGGADRVCRREILSETISRRQGPWQIRRGGAAMRGAAACTARELSGARF